MRTDTHTAFRFFRQVSLDSFREFLGPARLEGLRELDNPKRRRRKLGLEGFLWLGLFVAAYSFLPSLQAVFLCLAPYLMSGNALPLPPVSVSAFTQFRQRFPLRLLRALWAQLAQEARQPLRPEHASWHGLRLWAVDGTDLLVPEDLWHVFGAHRIRQGEGFAQAHLLVLYDLASRVPVACRLSQCDPDERQRAGRLFGTLAPGDLLLIDAGFYSIGVFADLDRRGVKFVVPMRKNGQPHCLQAFGPQDGLYSIAASNQHWKDHPAVPRQLTVRIVTVHRKGFRPRRLVTNLLDAQAFPAEEIAQLYHRRWHIETFYRELKHTLHLQRWHARTLHSLYAELFFMMILTTLTRLAMAQAAGDQDPGMLSFARSLGWVLAGLHATTWLPPSDWPALYAHLLRQIRRCRIDLRPGRQFERHKQKRRAAARAKRLATSKGNQP